MWASAYGHADWTRVLVELGTSLQAFDEDGDTSLILASRNGHAQVVRVLIEKGALIEAADKVRAELACNHTCALTNPHTHTHAHTGLQTHNLVMVFGLM